MIPIVFSLGKSLLELLLFFFLSALMLGITEGVHDWYESDNFVLEIIMLLSIFLD